jgi:hypothetical protein
MDFDFLSSNLQIAYPFQQNVTVGRAGANTEVAPVLAAARIRSTDQRDERLTLVSVYLESIDDFATFDEAHVQLAWQPSGDLLDLSFASGTSNAVVQRYGNWIVASWYAPRDMSGASDIAIKLIFPADVIEIPATSSSSPSSSSANTVVIQVDKLTDELTFHSSVVSQGPNKVRRVYWKRGDTMELIAAEGEEFIVQAGFNMSIGAGAGELTSERQVTRVAIDAVPGAGFGRYLICKGSQYLLTMNGVNANPQGELVLSPQECYWQTQELRDGITPITPEHGVTGSARLKAHEVKLNNACGPCCSCDDYITTYNNLHRLWERAQSASSKLYELSVSYSSLVGLHGEIAGCSELNLLLAQRNPDQLIVTLSLCNDTETTLNSDTDDQSQQLLFELVFTPPSGVTLEYLKGSGLLKSSISSIAQDPTPGTAYKIRSSLLVPPYTTTFWVGIFTISGDYDGKTLEAALLASGGGLISPRSTSAAIELEQEE